jgi:hypothetical protein
MMPFKMIISIPCFDSRALPKSMNNMIYEKRFIVYERSLWRRKIKYWAMPPYPSSPLKKSKIICQRHSMKQQDFDNLVGSFKYVIDALVFNGILEDDSPKHLERQYEWIKAPKGKYKIVLLIEEINTHQTPTDQPK